MNEADYPINWSLLDRYRRRRHPLHDFEMDEHECTLGVREVMDQIGSAHHLLDLAGIPKEWLGQQQDVSDLDARVYRLVMLMLDLDARLNRIKNVHARETTPGGMVGDYCVECGLAWPCVSRQLALTGDYNYELPGDYKYES
jgi:hypothetical protein